jgi:hypothetical protein
MSHHYGGPHHRFNGGMTGGLPFLHSFGTENTSSRDDAGNLTMTDSYNVATGVRALYSNTTGSHKTASGARRTPQQHR